MLKLNFIITGLIILKMNYKNLLIKIWIVIIFGFLVILDYGKNLRDYDLAIPSNYSDIRNASFDASRNYAIPLSVDNSDELIDLLIFYYEQGSSDDRFGAISLTKKLLGINHMKSIDENIFHKYMKDLKNRIDGLSAEWASNLLRCSNDNSYNFYGIGQYPLATAQIKCRSDPVIVFIDKSNAARYEIVRRNGLVLDHYNFDGLPRLAKDVDTIKDSNIDSDVTNFFDDECSNFETYSNIDLTKPGDIVIANTPKYNSYVESSILQGRGLSKPITLLKKTSGLCSYY